MAVEVTLSSISALRVPAGATPIERRPRLELARFHEKRTVLVGRNGSGKSMLLEAVAVYGADAEPMYHGAPDGGFEGQVVVLREARRDFLWHSVTYGLAPKLHLVRHVVSWTEDSGQEQTWASNVLLGEGRRTDDHTRLLQHVTAMDKGGSESTLGVAVAGRWTAGLRHVRASAPRFRPRRPGRALTLAAVNDVQTPGGYNLALSDIAAEWAASYLAADELPSWRVSDDLSRDEPRLAALALALANWHDRARATFDELVAVAQRLGLGKSLICEDALVDNQPKYRTLHLDGVELAQLSDGTLRLLEILVHLIDPTCTLLLIDEPEASVHPGLLSALLAEFDAYGADKQLILATHSPQVVSWCRPEHLRLVTWEGGAPRVYEPTPDQITRIEAYLADAGDLGEWLYEGGDETLAANAPTTAPTPTETEPS